MIKTRKQGSTVGPLLWAFALAAVLLAVSFSASNATGAGAQAEEGDIIIYGECVTASVTVLESDAAFTSVFWRFGPDSNLGINSQQVGSTAVIGELPANTELILGIVVNDTGNTFLTGPGDRNPDGLVHAIVSGDIVGFEDKALGEPNADFDYNDAMLQLTIEPCPRPEQVTLTLDVDPASTGTGGVSGGGTFDIGTIANPSAVPTNGSSFGGWSGDCGGFNVNIAVVMDSDRACFALFSAAPVGPTPEPTPEPTAVPLALAVGIDNTLVSLNPARLGEDVTFRVDVTLVDAPVGNTVDVQYTFDDSELGYLGASAGGFDLSAQCSLSGAGVIDCSFGLVSLDFAYDLNFEALTTADDSTTEASLSSDPDGVGALAPIVAGPALDNVDIIAITGSIPDTGDGSAVATAGGNGSFQLLALLGAIVLATGAGAARIRNGVRS